MLISISLASINLLQTLSLSANSFSSGSAPGTVIGNILNLSPGSTVSIYSQSSAGAFQIVGTQLQVGVSPPSGLNILTVTIQETLSGATNSPNVTGPLTIIETASIGTTPSMFNDPSYSALIAAVAA